MPFFKSSEDYFKEMTSTLNDVDASKPGFIYNSLRPASYEFSYQSMMMDEIIKMMFVKTQLSSKYYDYLLERCSEMGINRKMAEATIGKVKILGKPNSKFPSGSLVSTLTGLTYTINNDVLIDTTGIGYVGITASEAGSKYNVDVGEINTIPVKYEGILSVTNEDKISNGYDDETYEALYERYLLKVQTPATSGNKYHYQNWALEVDGVGSARVYPLWNGNGTVKVVIANSNYRAASSDLIKTVADHIEENRPIGATVTVVSVDELSININTKLSYDSVTYTLDAVKLNIKNSINEYLKNSAQKLKEISIMKIGSLILSATGVNDCSNVTVNNSSINIPVNDNQIAVIGEVICNVT